MRIAFAAGDIGGARAILPVARLAAQRGLEVTAMRNGPFADEGDLAWDWQPRAAFASDDFWQGGPTVLIFASSVTDVAALIAADRAATSGRTAVLHVLDNWSSYAKRLILPTGKRVQPEAYAVMDRLAQTEALADGVDASLLRVTGHPGLSHLGEEIDRFPGPLLTERPRLLFVSEPARADSGGDGTAEWRGYDEVAVANLLAHSPRMAGCHLHVCPHPREDRQAVRARWQALADRFGFDMELVPTDGVRAVLHAAHGVVGMTSILLYEAWLLGKPVLSLQPGLKIQSLRALKARDGLLFCDDADASSDCIETWIEATRIIRPRMNPRVHEHLGSPAVVLETGMELARRGPLQRSAVLDYDKE